MNPTDIPNENSPGQSGEYLNRLAVRDEYAFDLLELGEEYSERELERSLISRIEDFLRSMGGMFAFMGRQYRLEDL